MNTQDNGGPAFPVSDPMQLQPGTVDEMKRLASGMSTRDYFAAKAMQSFVQGAVLPPGFDASEQLAFVAVRSYEMADHMLKARQS